MQPVSYRRHQFAPEIIRHAIWLYLRFTLSYRDVEELLAERGLEVSYESIRRWVFKFARNLRRLRPRPSGTWHLDEMVVSIQGPRMYLWRAVNSKGEVLGVVVQSRRDKAAAVDPALDGTDPRAAYLSCVFIGETFRRDEKKRFPLLQRQLHERVPQILQVEVPVLFGKCREFTGHLSVWIVDGSGTNLGVTIAPDHERFDSEPGRARNDSDGVDNLCRDEAA